MDDFVFGLLSIVTLIGDHTRMLTNKTVNIFRVVSTKYEIAQS